MNKFLIASIFCIGSLSFSTGSSASDFDNRVDRVYVDVSGGMNMLEDTDFNFATGVDVENEYDNGVYVAGELGYNFGKFLFVDNVKIGAEVSYTENDIDVHNIPALGGAQAASTGDISATTVLANMYHEFDTQTKFVPYYGLGAGFSKIDAEGYGVQAAPNALEDDDTSFVYQLTAGVDYMLSDNVDLGLRYRYLASTGAEWKGLGANAVEQDLDYETQIVSVKLGYRF